MFAELHGRCLSGLSVKPSSSYVITGMSRKRLLILHPLIECRFDPKPESFRCCTCAALVRRRYPDGS